MPRDRWTILPDRDRPHHVVDEPSETRRVLVVDVLRFVGDLVVVLCIAERDINDRNVLPDVVHLVATTEPTHRIGGHVPGSVDRHRFCTHSVDRVDDVAIRLAARHLVVEEDHRRLADQPVEERVRHAWTLNLSLPREAVDRAGGFCESLPGAAYEDVELAWRLSRRGLPVLFRARARVTHIHWYEPGQYLARERALGRDAWTLAKVNPQCAAELFGRDVTSDGEVAYSLEFVERELAAAERIERSFRALAGMPASAVDGPHADELIETDSLGPVLDALHTLNDREATVVKMRFGLEAVEPRTLKEIGESLGLTRERVRQIETEALNKLAAAIE